MVVYETVVLLFYVLCKSVWLPTFQAECKKYDGHLVTINNAMEYETIIKEETGIIEAHGKIFCFNVKL